MGLFVFGQHDKLRRVSQLGKEGMMDIQVKTVETNGDDVIVSFTDGCKATFVPYGGFQVEGLRHFHLKQGNTVICSYNSRLYRSGSKEDEYRIKTLREGYTQQQVAAYWGTARDYLRKEYFEKPDNEQDEHLRYPWILVCSIWSWIEYERLLEGRAEFLKGQEDRLPGE
jgi:hypothetical protein